MRSLQAMFDSSRQMSYRCLLAALGCLRWLPLWDADDPTAPLAGHPLTSCKGLTVGLPALDANPSADAGAQAASVRLA